MLLRNGSVSYSLLYSTLYVVGRRARVVALVYVLLLVDWQWASSAATNTNKINCGNNLSAARENHTIGHGCPS